MVIYKFSFGIAGRIEISMPKGAKILLVETQNDVPCIWALCDIPKDVSQQCSEVREFAIFGTGHEGVEGIHIASFQQGRFVWHLFEI